MTPEAARRKNVAESEAALLVAFVNTRDVEQGTDVIADPESLAAWAAASAAGLSGIDADLADHRGVLALRESLRALMRANNGGDAGEQELAALGDAVERSRIRIALKPGGRLVLEPGGASVEALEARLLLALERAQALGTWNRVKACPDEGCQWAFFDSSRNRSRTWCSMDECGNRAKTRRYRGRLGSR